jgi:hypothetical protein
MNVKQFYIFSAGRKSFYGLNSATSQTRDPLAVIL